MISQALPNTPLMHSLYAPWIAHQHLAKTIHILSDFRVLGQHKGAFSVKVNIFSLQHNCCVFFVFNFWQIDTFVKYSRAFFLTKALLQQFLLFIPNGLHCISVACNSAYANSEWKDENSKLRTSQNEKAETESRCNVARHSYAWAIISLI